MPAATAGRGLTQFGRSWRVLGTAHAAADVLRRENSGLTTIGGHRVGFEYKVGDVPKLTHSMAVARHDLELDQLFLVAPVAKPFTLATGIDVVP